MNSDGIRIDMHTWLCSPAKPSVRKGRPVDGTSRVCVPLGSERGTTDVAKRRSHRTLAGLLAVLLLISVVAVLPGPQAEGASSNPVVPEDGALLGIYAKPKDGDWTKAGVKHRFNHLQSLAGREFDIGHYYYGFTAKFPTWREQWHRNKGRVPLVSWDARTSTQVSGGQHDATIRVRADNVKAHNDPVLIRYGWEMSEGVNHAAAGSAAEFKAAWRHIVRIFRSRGADNAQFVWCPTAWSFHTGGAQQYYPGDEWVDWICADGYNWAPRRAGDPWREFGEIFDAFYSWASRRDKPLMVGEFGVQEGSAGRKGKWFRKVPSTLQNEYPDIKAIVYFDSGNPYPWWMDTSSTSVAGFKDMALDPYLNNGLTFQSGFDRGLSKFAKKKNVTVDTGQGDDTGAPSAVASATGKASYLQANFGAAYNAMCVATSVKLSSVPSNTTLLRLQNSSERLIGRLFVKTGTRELWVRADKKGKKRPTGVRLSLNRWYDIELCGSVGAEGSWQVSVDGSQVLDWQVANRGWLIKQFRLGQSFAGTFVVRYDDVSAQIP